MKVGLLDTRAARLGAYWSAYLKELGTDLAAPGVPDGEALEIGRQSLPTESPVVQLALGRILALGRVDAALVPDLGAVGGDAWGEAFTELLPRRISGLPDLIALPDADLGNLEGEAATVGLRVSGNAGGVRLALERVRPLAAAGRGELPRLARAGSVTVGVIGPRALLAEPLLAVGLRAALEAAGLYGVYSPDLPLADVQKRAKRMDGFEKAPAGERELFGAASLLAGKGAVRGLIYAAPARDTATERALTRAARQLHKPALHLAVDAGQTDFPELAAFRAQLAPEAAAPETDPQENA